MAVLRSVDTSGYGGEHVAAVGLLCGIMCSVLALKFKFNLDFTRSSWQPETPTIVGSGVYKVNQGERYAVNVSLPTHRPIDPSKVQLPPPLPSTPPPTKIDEPVIEFNIPEVHVKDKTVSDNPKGAPIIETSASIADDTPEKKLTKKEKKQLDKKEKERIREQKKKDKVTIAEILKEDSERISREAHLLNEKKKEKNTAKESKKSDKPAKVEKKTKDKSSKKKENVTPAPVATNPLAQVATATNPLAQRSNENLSTISSNSGPPPPYSGPKLEVTPSEIDSSGNTSFGKPVQSMGGTWDMISQHRQQVQRPVKVTATTNIDNSRYNVGATKQGAEVPGQPRKSLYV